MDLVQTIERHSNKVRDISQEATIIFGLMLISTET